MGQFVMRFRLRTALFVASALLAFNVSARDDLDAAKVDASETAIAAFKTMAKDSATTGNVPRESDPAAKALLDKIFDDSDVVATKNVRFNDLTPLSARMGNGVQAALVYMLAGTGATEIQQLESDPNAATKVNLNVIKFAPEMGRYYDFQLTVQGAIWEAVAVKVATSTRMELANVNFQNALAQIRDGGHRVIAGIETLAVNGVTDEWRRGRLPALHAIVPQAAKILQPEQKKQLQELARACADVMDDAAVKEGLQKFAVAIGG
jgi:hypothetical protein